MITILYGPDSFRKQKKARWIIDEYKTKHADFVYKEFDFDGELGDGASTLEELKDFVLSRSLFEVLNFAFVKNLFSVRARAAVKKFLKLYLESSDTYLLLFEGNTIPKEFDFLEGENVKKQAFDLLGREKMKFFIEQEMKERGVTSSSRAAEELINIYGTDTWAIVQEMDRVSLGTHVPGELSRADDFFGLINVLSGSYDYKRKLPALERLFAAKADGAKIFNILASILVRKGSRVEDAARYDIAVKSGKLDYESVLVDFCLT